MRSVQWSFAGGELSPRLRRRADLAYYATGAAEIMNLAVVPEGGLDRLPGTWRIFDLEGDARLIPFVFSEAESFLLVFTAGRMRVFNKWGPLATTNFAAYEIATPWSREQTLRLRHTQSADVVWLFVEDAPPQELQRHGDLDWRLAPAEFRNGPFLDENHEETTLQASVTGSIDFATDPETLSGEEAATWFRRGTPVALTASEAIFESGHIGALWRIDQADLSATPQWVGNVEISAGDEIAFGGRVYRAMNSGETAPNAPGHDYGVQADAPGEEAIRWLHLHDGFGVVRITGVSSETEAEGVIESRLPSSVVSSSSSRWREGAFSPKRGWPRNGCIWEMRLVLAEGGSRAHAHHLSRSQDLGNFASGSEDDAAISRPLISQRAPAIQWFAPGRSLLIATVGREWVGRPASGRSLTPTSYETKEATTEGSTTVEGLEVDGRVLFFDGTGRRLLEFFYDYQIDSFVTQDLSIRSAHISSAKIRRMAWQKSPHRLLWCLFEDGGLAVLSYHRDQQVLAWSRADFGAFDDGRVEDLAVIPDPEHGEHSLFLVVRRNGRLGIERLGRFFDLLDGGFYTWTTRHEADGRCWLDSALLYEGAETTRVAGLEHLEGCEVDLVEEGRWRGRARVADGGVDLPWPMSRVMVGLPRRWTLKTLPLDAPEAGGLAGRVKQLTGLVVDVAAGMSAFAQMEETRYREPVFSREASPVESRVQPNEKRIPPPAGASLSGGLTLTDETPYPFCLRSVIREFES